jgi:hypothetical protein
MFKDLSKTFKKHFNKKNVTRNAREATKIMMGAARNATKTIMSAVNSAKYVIDKINKNRNKNKNKTRKMRH